MNLLPFGAESFDVVEQLVFDAGDLWARKAVILPHRYRASRAVEIEHSFSSLPMTWM